VFPHVATITYAQELGGVQKRADDEKTGYKEGVPLYEMNRL